MGHEIISVQVAADTAAAADTSFFATITHSGPLAFFVLLVLLVFSVVSWGIIIRKWLAIRQAQRASVEFLETFWQSKKLDDIFQRSENMQNSPIAQVFRAGYQELVKVKQREEKDEKGLLGGTENVERSLRRAAGVEMTELGRLVPFLATVGSTAPFIGLFGTVVGIMKSFQEIGLQGSATSRPSRPASPRRSSRRRRASPRRSRRSSRSTGSARASRCSASRWRTSRRTS